MKADRDILSKLTTDEALSALLNRALAGLRRLEAQQHFTECPSVHAATKAYRAACDSVYEFIQARLRADPHSWILKDEVFSAYTVWCEEVGIQHPVSKRTFNKGIVETLGGKEVRDPTGESKRRAWLGISWKPESEDAEGRENRVEPEKPGSPYYPSPTNEPACPLFTGEKLAGPGSAGPTRSDASEVPLDRDDTDLREGVI